MAERIRKADVNDFENLMRFLEKSYGHRRNYFAENYAYLLKDVFGAAEDEPKGSYIVEDKGKILSHVGLYPVNIMSDGIKITAGGIGNVATRADARGRGHMGNLLSRAVSDMEKGGVFLSVLWGDRHRYGNFGWETAGEKLNLLFSARSFEKSGAERIEDLEEVEPKDAVSEIRKFHKKLRFRAERGKKLRGIISRSGNRVWLSEDGYLCGADMNGLRTDEVYSSSGNEAGFILSAMEWAGHSRASLALSPEDKLLIQDLLPAAAGWESAPEGVFRVNSWMGLLGVFSPLLEEKAVLSGARDFIVSIEIDGGASREKIGIAFHEGEMRIIRGAAPGAAVRVSGKDAARLFLGGPCSCRKELEPLKALLPLPVHIPLLDHV